MLNFHSSLRIKSSHFIPTSFLSISSSFTNFMKKAWLSYSHWSNLSSPFSRVKLTMVSAERSESFESSLRSGTLSSKVAYFLMFFLTSSSCSSGERSSKLLWMN